MKAYYLKKTFVHTLAATEEDTEKTLMLFWKVYKIYNLIRKLAWTWGDVSKKCINSIWKKTLKIFVYNSKGFAKGEEVTKINKVVVPMANTFKLGVNVYDIKGFLEVVPEELSNEFSELEQKYIAEEEVT